MAPAFLNLRRDIWNSNTWANNAAGRARPKERFNEQGVGGGGPVFIPKIYDGRNKTFFFMTYTLDKRPITASHTVGHGPDRSDEAGRLQRVAGRTDHLRSGHHVGEHSDAVSREHHSEIRCSTISTNLISAHPGSDPAVV